MLLKCIRLCYNSKNIEVIQFRCGDLQVSVDFTPHMDSKLFCECFFLLIHYIPSFMHKVHTLNRSIYIYIYHIAINSSIVSLGSWLFKISPTAIIFQIRSVLFSFCYKNSKMGKWKIKMYFLLLVQDFKFKRDNICFFPLCNSNRAYV